MASVGERIRARRLALGLSLREAACVGVSSGFLSRVERGARVPSGKTLRMLAEKLDVSVRWLETGAEGSGEELARLVLEHQGRPLPVRARGLARRVLH